VGASCGKGGDGGRGAPGRVRVDAGVLVGQSDPPAFRGVLDCDDLADPCDGDRVEVCDGVDNDNNGAVDDGVLGSGPACPASSCLAIRDRDASQGDGLYWLRIGADPAFQTTCDMTTLGGGWTLVQRTVWDWTQSQALLTNYATWHGSNVGTAAGAFRIAGRRWPVLQSTREHLLTHRARNTDGTSCTPLSYVAPHGTWAVQPATNSATITGAYQPVGWFFAATETRLSTTNSGPSGCPSGSSAVPWTYEGCCWTCPTYQGSYWVDSPHPMANYLPTADLNGRTVATACTAPVISSGYYGINAMEYFVR
jgi:hypothetical protein